MKTKKRTAPAAPAPELITSNELADRWGINEGSLRMMRVAGRGPRYLKLGTGPRPRIRYRLAEVVAFEKNHGGAK